MRGHVLGFDPAGNTGAISGDDGRRYAFRRADWRGPGLPRPGQAVDFLAEPAGGGGAAGAVPGSVPASGIGLAREIWPLPPAAERAATAGTADRATQPQPPAFTWGWFLFSFQGRVPRGWFWLRWLLPLLVLYFAAGFAAGLWLEEPAASAANGVLSLLLIWPSLAVGAKRCHDRDKSGWWQLLTVIPVIGTLWYLIDLGCLRGTPGANRFGADPLREPGMPPETAAGPENRD